MAAKVIKTSLLIGLAVAMLSFDLPSGWIIAGDSPKSYNMGVDKGAGQGGKNAGTIKSIDKKINGFGTLMQECLPDKYIGKRVRMSGYLKTQDVSDWSGFWLRVDTKEGDKNIPFDNMHDGKKDRSIKGTTDWTRYEIVLDIPVSAKNLAYGALLCGTGQIWFDDLKFEIVDNSVPVTGIENTDQLNSEPTNLDFSK